MSMTNFHLTYGPHDFHGIRVGSGPALLVCLHGFGETAAHFAPLAAGLGDRFTIIGLDLPLHGDTLWAGNKPITKTDLKNILTALLQQEGHDRFTLLGYSMGGRVALCAVECMAAQIDGLVLMAADGLFNNPWHVFVTQTWLGNRIFRYQTYHPQIFFRLLIWARGMGWINESIYKFAYSRMDTEEKRLQVYEVWTIMRRMMPDVKRCTRELTRYKIPLLQLFGKYDRVIPPAFARRFENAAGFPVKTIVLDKGHQLISEQIGHTINTNL